MWPWQHGFSILLVENPCNDGEILKYGENYYYFFLPFSKMGEILSAKEYSINDELENYIMNELDINTDRKFRIQILLS